MTGRIPEPETTIDDTELRLLPRLVRQLPAHHISEAGPNVTREPGKSIIVEVRRNRPERVSQLVESSAMPQ